MNRIIKKTNIRKAIALAVVSLFLLTAIATVNANTNKYGDPDNPDPISDITLSFSFPPPVISEVTINGTLFNRVTMDGLPSVGTTGVPRLPVKPVRVLLPQQGILESIDVSVEGEVSPGAGFVVELGQESMVITEGIYKSLDATINFDLNLPYPGELFSIIGTYNFRGYSILMFNLHPVHYLGETGELYYYPDMTVTVKTCETDHFSSLLRGKPEDRTMMQQKVDDYSMEYTYSYDQVFSSNSSIVDPSEFYDYVIITAENLVNVAPCPPDDLGWYTFQDFADYKNAHGTDTTIVTIEEIEICPEYWVNGTWGDNNLSNPFYEDEILDEWELFNDTECHIRNFIRDAYWNWGIEYVLIGGDQDIIPARYLCTSMNSSIPSFKYIIPSDLYYTCLNGNYNVVTNDRWGEKFDGGPCDDVHQPIGSGEYYAEADSSQYGVGFDVGLFTPSLNLTGCTTAQLEVAGFFLGPSESCVYTEVNAYSGGTNSDNLEENIWNYSTEESESIYFQGFTFDPSDYSDPANVYIEFYYNDNDSGEWASLNIDDISVKKDELEILREGFEGSEFPPINWTQIAYNGDKYWSKERYYVDVDLFAEVYIGRACTGNPIEVRNFVLKTLAYENTPAHDPYLEKVLLAGEKLDDYTWGGDHKDEIIDGTTANGYTTIGIPSDQYTIDTLYDKNWLGWPGNNWPVLEIISRINNGLHIINHVGHGSNTVSMKMHNLGTLLLMNNELCFVYSVACFSGSFDNCNFTGDIVYDDCSAEYLTVKTPYGAFAVIMNARFGWYTSSSTDGPSQHYDRQFWDAIYGEGITELGKANQDSKEDTIGLHMSRYCYYELNLFGDPQISLKHPVENSPPDNPDTPSGSTDVYRGETRLYTTLAVDPEDDEIYYQWDWDEPPFNPGSWYLFSRPSGVPEKRAHTWLTLGEHEVRVRAKDIYGAVGEWSDPLTVTVNRLIPDSCEMI